MKKSNINSQEAGKAPVAASVANLAALVSQASGLTKAEPKPLMGPSGRPMVKAIYDRRDGTRARTMIGEKISTFCPRPDVTIVQLRLVNLETKAVSIYEINQKNLDLIPLYE